MTPFSSRLKAYRESRGLRQKALACSLDVGQTYLSALEQGRKSPPQNIEFFEKLKGCLYLTESEMQELQNLAVATKQLGPLALGASTMQLDVALMFASRLRQIPPGHLRAIKAILELLDDGDSLAYTKPFDFSNKEGT